ncbi:MAG: hypothetical protein CVU57_06400 [Deltaproteobacteria bacterium HGW-Deltaproteobacteria-15]|nr:MAG: hypothetical protein CVU57_06400 [Deltaproteobacteria bacterium HGW-Deltaproteobacteria-15]
MPDKEENSDRTENTFSPDDQSSVQDDGTHPEQKAAEQEEDRSAFDEPNPSPPAFPIIGIGASAGGLEALESFFSALPDRSGMAFVVVTHTSPEHESLLPEILRRKSRTPVKLIQDGMKVEENAIYLPPSDRDAILEQGVFRFRPRPNRGEVHMPVDLFLKHLAKERGESAGCVILSGTGTDGTQGVRLIKEEGGLVIAQSEGSARHAGMPASAVDTGLVDFVLSPSEMPGQLMEYFRHPVFRLGPADHDKKEPDPLYPILSFLASRTRHDFSLYKDNTLTRRIERRMVVTRSQSASEYREFLHRNPEEIRTLFQELLIGVTSFFRDPEAFSFLKEKVLQDLISRKIEGQPFRVWTPGCSTGEEAFSVAILVKECLEETNTASEVQIFGTDIDPQAIEKARVGVYAQSMVADVDPERIRRFFAKEGAQYRIKREIREMVVFAEQNVLRDPPFSNLDLLVCRNLLIYLKPEAHARLLPLFHYTLQRDGVLFLGKSESVSRFPDLFDPLSKQHSIYRKRDSVTRPQVQFPTGPTALKPLAERYGLEMEGKGHLNVAEAAEKVLMKEYTPASVIVNQNYEIIHFHGRTGKYLEPAPGRPNMRVTDMAREGLRVALMSALRQAGEQNREIREKGLRVKTNGGFQSIDLTVKSFTEPPLKDCLMVVFEDADAPAEEEGKEHRYEAVGEDGGRSERLEHELMRVRQNYQGALEELESSNEELRSVNEEVHSSNEELQSANEELESSREELQSLNEELTTANSELHRKIGEVNEAYQAINDVLESTRIAIVFLDNDLRVQRFTSEATRLTNLIDTDLGRPIEHISTNLDIENLLEKSRQVLKSLRPFDQEVRTKDDHCYHMRIMVHRSGEKMIQGVVLTFVNIDAQKSAQEEVEKLTAREVASARRFAESIVDTVRESLLVLDPERRVITANRRFYETFGTSPDETEGRVLFDLGNRQWDIPALRELLQETAERAKTFQDFLVEHQFPEIGFKRMLLNGRIFREERGESRILLAIDDVTDSAGAGKG